MQEIDRDEVADCDGCNEKMDFALYQTHECPAYANSEFKNPWHHKMSKATWKTPKGTLVAKGRILTKRDIEMAKSKLPREEDGLGDRFGAFVASVKRNPKKAAFAALLIVAVIVAVSNG